MDFCGTRLCSAEAQVVVKKQPSARPPRPDVRRFFANFGANESGSLTRKGARITRGGESGSCANAIESRSSELTQSQHSSMAFPPWSLEVNL